jgi:hypothetical protein
MLTMFFASVIFGLIAYLARNIPRWRAEAARIEAAYRRQEDADGRERGSVNDALNAIHTKLGRYPKDEAELVELRGKPMPMVHPRDGQMYPMTYSKDPNETTYRLNF